MTPAAPGDTSLAAREPTLEGRVALITGSARGIGRAIAERLANWGARVVINGVDEAAVHAAARAIPGDTLPLPGDITITATPDLLVGRTVERWGRLDIVVNNAGYNWDSPLRTMTDEQFQAMLDIHVTAPFRVLRAAAPFLLDRAEAGDPRHFRKVVNISSVSGTMGNPNQANYNAGKAAIIGLTKGLAKEWGPQGVNVNAVAPGFIDTRLTALREEAGTIVRHEHEISLGITPEHRQNGSERVPIGRMGTPVEVANTVAFLCSPLGDYVHGQVLSVTGGLSMGMES